MDNQNNGLDDAVMLTDDVVQYLTYQMEILSNMGPRTIITLNKASTALAPRSSPITRDA